MIYRCVNCGFETDDPEELEEHKITHMSSTNEEDEWS
jgi:DNA-directed RNA polymerase subunit RPC12/RpoP